MNSEIKTTNLFVSTRDRNDALTKYTMATKTKSLFFADVYDEEVDEKRKKIKTEGVKSELNWFEITLCDGLKFGYACVNVDVIVDCVHMSEMRASLHLQNEFETICKAFQICLTLLV